MKMLSKYPSHLKGQKRTKCMKDHVVPEDSWIEYQYRRLKVCGDWEQAKEMERRAADDESDDLKTMQEPRKKRLVRQPVKYSLNSYVMGNRKSVYSSSSDEASGAVPSFQVLSKQKRSSDDLEDELQPATCVAEWNLLMQVLKSESNKQIIVDDFARLGGSDLADIVKRIMREVVTDEFGAGYVGWMGQHGKYPVFGTKLMDVIFASVDRSLLLPPATRKQVEGATMNCIHRFNQHFCRAETQVADNKDESDIGDSEKNDDDDALHDNNIENRVANVSDIESDNNDDPNIINSSENSVIDV